ncbi:MAG: hypothetical protein ACREJ6_03035 [Candidatus Methylomirabilis sp.]
MAEYDVKKLDSEEALLKELGITELAGSDVPDCSMGVFLVRFTKASKVTAADIAEALKEEKWTGDLPLVLVSRSGFTPDAISSTSEFEDAHVFAPSA